MTHSQSELRPLHQLGIDKLRAANIHPTTGLATDYLNHYNEIIMLLELVPDMPEMVHETLHWEPLDYVEHYANSNYRAKDLVVQAYHCSPAKVRKHLHDLIDTMDAILVSTIDSLKKDPEGPMAANIARHAGERVKSLAAETAGFMNGLVQEDDDMFGPNDGVQASIDELMH